MKLGREHDVEFRSSMVLHAWPTAGKSHPSDRRAQLGVRFVGKLDDDPSKPRLFREMRFETREYRNSLDKRPIDLQ